MKIRHLAFAACALLAATTATAAERPFYFGFKAGLLDPDAGGHDNALNIGGTLGYLIFDEAQGSGAIEGDVTMSLVKGDKDGGGEWHANTVAVFFAYRTTGDVFLTLKGGVADQNISGTDKIPDGSTFAAGVGVGFRANRQSGVELEYTQFDDLKFVNIGFFSHF